MCVTCVVSHSVATHTYWCAALHVMCAIGHLVTGFPSKHMNACIMESIHILVTCVVNLSSITVF
jgi:hypothetical protein